MSAINTDSQKLHVLLKQGAYVCVHVCTYVCMHMHIQPGIRVVYVNSSIVDEGTLVKKKVLYKIEGEFVPTKTP